MRRSTPARGSESATRAAKDHGTVVSYDLNYRASLWDAYGGQARAQTVNATLAPYVDVMFGNEEDFTQALGFDVPEPPSHNGASASLNPETFELRISDVIERYPNLSVVATTLRTVRSAGTNDWGAIAWSDGRFHHAAVRPGLDILDRVGGGDSFAAGLAYGLLTGQPPDTAVEYGAAHGALAMTTPGDTSMASLDDVHRLAHGGNARVRR
ncbi:PfkB family carbohydrate kinase [Lapillicoccus sp.]|uniref:PfkB family carbohydrate kinase n=1 Tax=Lapillicoccus sp. TaxID=1909287 RepID=UPI0039C8FB55